MYYLIFQDKKIECSNKAELITAWTEEFFFRKCEPYRIISNGETLFKSKMMNRWEMSEIEKLPEIQTTCENGSCSIDFGDNE